MTSDCQFVECVKALEDCVSSMKKMTTKLEHISKIASQEALFKIEEGIEALDHLLEEETYNENIK